MKTKVLVTGAAGFIGSNLCKRLVKDGHDVVAVDNLSSGRLSLLSPIVEKIEFVQDDFSCEQILRRVKSCEFSTVFHLAAIPRVSYSVEEPHETTVCNVSKTVALMESCIHTSRDIGPRFIFSSSSSVYGGASELPTPASHHKDPKSPYAWQKSCIEDLLLVFSGLYDLDCVSLRYFNVFGPGQYGDSPYSTAVSAWCHAIKKEPTGSFN